MAKFFSSPTNSPAHSTAPNFPAKIPNHSPGPFTLAKSISPSSLTHKDRTDLSNLSFSSPSTLNDQSLYRLCQLYGGNAKKWLRKFAGLLPEVYKRALHLRRNCGSIQEFAKKLSGMNERTTDKILNLHRRLANMPHLLALFESGEQGWSKLEAVAFLATPETDKDLAEKVRSLPQKALFLWVKSFRENELIAQQNFTVDGQAQNDLRISQGHGAQSNLPLSPGIQEGHHITESPPIQSSGADSDLNIDSTSGTATPSYYAKSFHFSETFTPFSFPISTHSRQKLNLIKASLEKQHKKTLTWNQVIELWPTTSTRTFSPQIKVCPSCALQKIKPHSTRHIPTAIKSLVLAIHGQTCVFPNCSNAYSDFHHLTPYAICKKHDPKNIYPVCKTHHTLSHDGLIENSEKPPAHWAIRDQPIQNSVDKKTMKFKASSPLLN